MDLDNTKRSSFVACPRKYYWAHERNIVPAVGSNALRYGSAFHGGMEAYYTVLKESGWANKEKALEAAIVNANKVFEEETSKRPDWYPDYRTLENLCAAILQYHTTFISDSTTVDIVSLEQVFDIPLCNLKNGEVLNFTGRLDMVVGLSGAHWLNEFKTTGQPIGMQVNRLNRSPQLLGYQYAMTHLGIEAAGALITMHHISSRQTKDGGYGKLNIDFRREPQVFSARDLLEWQWSFVHTANQIAECQSTKYWPCHFDSCYQFGACSYLNLCQQHRYPEEVDVTGYVHYKWDVREA